MIARDRSVLRKFEWKNYAKHCFYHRSTDTLMTAKLLCNAFNSFDSSCGYWKSEGFRFFVFFFFNHSCFTVYAIFIYFNSNDVSVLRGKFK